MEIDEDLRILSAMKKQNPGYQLTESVKRKIRKDLFAVQTPTNHQAEKNEKIFPLKKIFELDSTNDYQGPGTIADLQEQVRLLTILHTKKELGTTGFVAGVLKWDINIFTDISQLDGFILFMTAFIFYYFIADFMIYHIFR